jgi:hypothetical protein
MMEPAKGPVKRLDMCLGIDASSKGMVRAQAGEMQLRNTLRAAIIEAGASSNEISRVRQTVGKGHRPEAESQGPTDRQQG